MLAIIKWITVIDLSQAKIGAEGTGRLAAVLRQCSSLAHLDLCRNRIGDEGAGRLAAVLGPCASLDLG
jgi:Ran GTPase-activating protein (RanGAP) involved in mRNA processing and transport